MMRNRPNALFVSPASSIGQTSPVALWITAAGWASAVDSLGGRSWVLTHDGTFDADETLRRAVTPSPHHPRLSPVRRIPTVVKTLVKDMRGIGRSIRLRKAALSGPWMDSDVAFVWQQNGVFLSAGSEVARRKGVPFVLQVEAPVVWEASRWGVRRPGWSKLMERLGELPDMMRADVITCVSDEVADQVEAMGIARDKILVAPCSVDPVRFRPGIDDTRVRDVLGVREQFVIGWVGGFRSFHGIDSLLDCADSLAAKLPDLCLVLVGDGVLRASFDREVRRRGSKNVVFAGAVPYQEVPEYIAAMDVALVSSPETSGFHYSPLKLREYMACGKPVIAPNIGQVPDMAVDGHEALLVEPRNEEAMVSAIESLYRHPDLRLKLGANARIRVEQDGTWDYQLSRLIHALDVRRAPGRETA